MKQVQDDPIIRCIERTGYPPWYGREDYENDYDEGDGGDVYYGNSTEDF